MYFPFISVLESDINFCRVFLLRDCYRTQSDLNKTREFQDLSRLLISRNELPCQIFLGFFRKPRNEIEISHEVLFSLICFATYFFFNFSHSLMQNHLRYVFFFRSA